MPVRVGIDAAGHGTLLKHVKDVGAAPAPRVAAAVEDTIEVDRVVFPACRNGRDVLVQAGNESDVAGAGLRRHAGM